MSEKTVWRKDYTKRMKVTKIERCGLGKFWLHLACGHSQEHRTSSRRPIKTASCDTCFQAWAKDQKGE